MHISHQNVSEIKKTFSGTETILWPEMFRWKCGSEQMTNKRQSATVLLSGASGMLGTAICGALESSGMDVQRLVRRAASGPNEIFWDPERGSLADSDRLEGLSAVVHLSGVNVASQRWSKEFKEKIWSSRVGSTKLLSETLAGLREPPGVLVSASAAGFYGDRGDAVLDEDSAAGRGFFPELCAEWEQATKAASDAGVRVVHARFGVVLGRGPDGKPGGALEKMAPLFRMGLGGKLGDGTQWMSWISEEDAAGAVVFALEHGELRGAVNVVAPEPVTNAEFTKELGRAVHRPAVVAAPKFALRLAVGEMADEALLASARIVPERLLEAGYRFAQPTVGEALRAVFDPR
jgi:uncharacterized protein